MIMSTANRHIVEARKLRQRKHRLEQGLFLLEGLQLLTMALDAGLVPAQVFYCPEQFTGPHAPALIDRFPRSPAELVPVTPAVMTALSDRDGPQGIVATFPLFAAKPADLRLTGRELVLVLDRPQDPGNLGGLIRTADAVAAAGVVILEPAVDPFDPKAIRASMGSIFNLPVVLAPAAAILDDLAAARGIIPTGASEHAVALGGEPWGETALQGGCALVLGNEARGLSADVSALRPPLGWPAHARQSRVAQRRSGRRHPHVPLAPPQRGAEFPPGWLRSRGIIPFHRAFGPISPHRR